MWVGIFGVWLAVGCPAGVAYSDNFLCIFFGEDAFEGADSACGFVDIEGFVYEKSDACGVITAIFESFQAFDEYWAG